jgi:hypothetical protein
MGRVRAETGKRNAEKTVRNDTAQRANTVTSRVHWNVFQYKKKLEMSSRAG